MQYIPPPSPPFPPPSTWSLRRCDAIDVDASNLRLHSLRISGRVAHSERAGGRRRGEKEGGRGEICIHLIHYSKRKKI